MKKIFVKPEVVVKALQSENIIAASIDGFRAVQDDAISGGAGSLGGGNGDNEGRATVEFDWD